VDQAVRLATVADNLHYQVNTYKSDYLVENGSRKPSGNGGMSTLMLIFDRQQVTA